MRAPEFLMFTDGTDDILDPGGHGLTREAAHAALAEVEQVLAWAEAGLAGRRGP